MDDTQKYRTVRGYQLLQQNKNHLTSAMEDYLEMIYRHCSMEGYIRVNRISELLNVQAPSATKMVQKLSRLGLIRYEKYEVILLTEEGKEIGKFLLDRHNIIEKFLANIGVNENLLQETELIEHSISINTLNKFDMFNKFLEMEPELDNKIKKNISLLNL